MASVELVARPQGFTKNSVASGRVFKRLEQTLFYALLIVAVFWTVIVSLPIHLAISLGGSEMREPDLLVLCLLGVWLVARLLRTNYVLQKTRSNALNGSLAVVPMTSVLIGLVVVVLMLPVVIGLLNDKSPITVLRDFRVPMYYALLLPMSDVLETKTDLQRFVRFIFGLGTIVLLINLVMWALKIETDWAGFGAVVGEDIVTRYGIASSGHSSAG